MSNNVTREKNLQDLANAIKNYADSKLATISGSQPVLSSSADFTVYVPNDTSMLLTGKQTPYLSLGEWSKADTTYTASLSYSGDGNLSTNIGSISGTTLTVTDEDGIFSGIVTATAGTSFAATSLNFSYTEEAGSGGSAQKPVPTITFSPETLRYNSISSNDVEEIAVTYSGDYTGIPFSNDAPSGEVAVSLGFGQGKLYMYVKRWWSDIPISSKTVINVHFPETENYAAATATFTFTT